MKVFVNDHPVYIVCGMTVRHALLASGFHQYQIESLQVLDSFGNVTGLDGALSEGDRLKVEVFEKK